MSMYNAYPLHLVLLRRIAVVFSRCIGAARHVFPP